jgi:hypothetical protein
MSSDSTWSLLSSSLVVDDPLVQIELICELEAGEAEAWFDEESLLLRRE